MKKKLPRNLEAYMPLVHSIASMVSGKGLPPNIDYNDLVSDGAVGLFKAWENFDPKRGVKFETYASYRIRGEILDGLRNYSPVPYYIQVKIRDLAKKGYRAVVDRKSKGAEEEEKLLEKKELTEEEFRIALKRIKRIVSASSMMYLLSVEEMGEQGVEAPVLTESTPSADLEFAELKSKLGVAVGELPPQQRKVVELFYHKGLHQKTIAKQLKLSRPKVCRLLAKAVKTLQSKVKK